jgi:hypothetical protein
MFAAAILLQTDRLDPTDRPGKKQIQAMTRTVEYESESINGGIRAPPS